MRFRYILFGEDVGKMKGGKRMQTKLKALLYEKGVTQKQLAARLGVDQKTLSYKMKGKREFTFSEVWEICMALGVSNPFDVFVYQKRNEMR